MTEHLNLARLKKSGEHFEVVIHPDQAILVKQGKQDISNALVYPKVFSDARKGMLASEHNMQALFKTSDRLLVAKEIITHGEIQLTTEHKHQQLEQKKRQLIELIHKLGVDPHTNLPNPVTRIENAFVQAKIRVEENKTAEQQLDTIINQLRPILPLKIVTKKIKITLAPQHATKAIGTLKSFGTLTQDKWLSDGSWSGVLEIPGGLEQEFYDKLNKLTHGETTCTILEEQRR